MKRVSPAALVALHEALTAVYWYKRDLRSFVSQVVRDPAVLSILNWDDTKRNTVTLLVESLAQGDSSSQDTLMGLIRELVRIEDFSHLELLVDGANLAARARKAVGALSKLVGPREDGNAAANVVEERRKDAEAAVVRAQGERARLQELRGVFHEVISPLDPQRRGYLLEGLLRDLFTLFDLDPRASFRIAGEQIDGAFTFGHTDYLLEAKWQRELVGIEDLDAFSGKVSRKLENTLGLFVSVNGFSPTAVEAHERSRPALVLMDGADLMAVLEGRIRFDDLLLRKRQHAAQTGHIYLSIAYIMAGKG